MSEQDIITAADIKEAESYENLGPVYFTANRIAEEFLKDFSMKECEKLVKEAADKFLYELQEGLEYSLLSNMESNIQSSIYRTVDQIIKAILAGNDPWILERYALGSRYDCEAVRAAVAKHVPKELQDARIADLEVEVKRLQDTLKFYRDR